MATTSSVLCLAFFSFISPTLVLGSLCSSFSAEDYKLFPYKEVVSSKNDTWKGFGIFNRNIVVLPKRCSVSFSRRLYTRPHCPCPSTYEKANEIEVAGGPVKITLGRSATSYPADMRSWRRRYRPYKTDSQTYYSLIAVIDDKNQSEKAIVERIQKTELVNWPSGQELVHYLINSTREAITKRWRIYNQKDIPFRKKITNADKSITVVVAEIARTDQVEFKRGHVEKGIPGPVTLPIVLGILVHQSTYRKKWVFRPAGKNEMKNASAEFVRCELGY